MAFNSTLNGRFIIVEASCLSGMEMTEGVCVVSDDVKTLNTKTDYNCGEMCVREMGPASSWKMKTRVCTIVEPGGVFALQKDDSCVSNMRRHGVPLGKFRVFINFADSTTGTVWKYSRLFCS